MPAPLNLPADPLGRFRDIYHALTHDRSWLQSVMPFRYSALTLATTAHSQTLDGSRTNAHPRASSSARSCSVCW